MSAVLYIFATFLLGISLTPERDDVATSQPVTYASSPIGGAMAAGKNTKTVRPPQKRKTSKVRSNTKGKGKKSVGKKAQTRKGVTKSKKTTRKGRAASAKRAQRARAIENKNFALDRVAEDLPLETAIPAGLFLLYLLVLLAHRSHERRESAPSHSTDHHRLGPPVFEAKPVFLDGVSGPDPLANNGAGVQLSVKKTKERSDKESAKELNNILGGDGTFAGNEPSALLTSIPEALPTAEEPTPETLKSFLTLPVELAGLFQAQSGERNVWQCKWNLPLVSRGTLLLSNQRLLVAHEKFQYSFMPPFRRLELRRYQCPVVLIIKSEVSKVRRPSFLVAALGLCWWYPIGSVASAFSLTAYVFLARSELGIFTKGSQKRSYPVEARHLRDAINTIDHVKDEAESTESMSKAS